MTDADVTPIPNTPLPPPPDAPVEGSTPPEAEPSVPAADTDEDMGPLGAVAESIDDLVVITRTGMRRMIGLSFLVLLASAVLALFVYFQNERSARLADAVADTQNTLAGAIEVLRETKREVQQTQEVVSTAADKQAGKPDISIQQVDAGVPGRGPQYEVVIKPAVRPPPIKAPDGGEMKPPPAPPPEVKIPIKGEGAVVAPVPAPSAAPTVQQ